MFKLLKNGLVLQPDFTFKKQSILIQDDIIYDLLEPEQIPLKPVETEINLDGQVVFPGLINGHDHLIDTSWRSFGQMPVENWFEWESSIHSEPDYKLQQKLSASDLYIVGMYKNVIAGATTIVDHYPSEVSSTFTNHELASLLKYFYQAHSVSEKRLHWCSNIVEQYRNTQGILPFIIHAGEGKCKEISEEIDYLNKIDALSKNTVLVDCCFLKDSDLQLIASKKSSIVWIPESSERIFAAQPDIKRILELGIKLCIGTDSSNTGSSNMHTAFSAARKYSADFLNNSITPKDLIKMATIDAAQIFGIEKEVGSLVPGKRSDFIVFEDNGGDPFENFMNLMPEDYSMVIHKGNMMVGNDEFRRTSVDFSRYSEVKLNGATKLLFGRPVQLIERICNKLDKEIVFPFFDVLEED